MKAKSPQPLQKKAKKQKKTSAAFGTKASEAGQNRKAAFGKKACSRVKGTLRNNYSKGSLETAWKLNANP